MSEEQPSLDVARVAEEPAQQTQTEPAAPVSLQQQNQAPSIEAAENPMIKMEPEVVMQDDTARSTISTNVSPAAIDGRQDALAKQIKANKTRMRVIPAGLRNEYAVPVRLSAVQRKIYYKLLLDAAPLIESFCASQQSGAVKDEDGTRIQELLTSLEAVLTHPLLLAKEEPRGNLDDAQEAWYITQASSKFEMLVELIEALRQQPVRICVLYDSDKVLQLLKTVLRGLRVHYAEADTDSADASTQESSQGTIEVLLVAHDASYIPGEPVDLAIAFSREGTCTFAPVLRLVVINSSEHILRQSSNQAVIVSGTAALYEQVGQGGLDAADLVSKTIQFLCGHPLVATLPDALNLNESDYEGSIYSASAAFPDSSQQPLTGNKKRKLDGNSAGSGHVSGRFDRHPRVLVTDIDGVEVHTEEATSTAQPAATDAPEQQRDGVFGQAMDYEVGSTNDGDADNSLQQQNFINPASLSHGLTPVNEDTKISIFGTDQATQTSVDPQVLAESRAQVLTLQADLERLAGRFDELREECRGFGEARDEAEAKFASLQKRFDRLTEEVRQARIDRQDARAELEKAKMPLLPEESSPEFIATENRRLKTELERAKKSSEARQQDFDFLRQQYQQSSSAAAELASEKETLELDIKQLKAREEGGLAYKLARLQASQGQAAAEERCKDLEARNAVLVEQLKRMRDAREALLTLQQGAPRGRERTRASSAQDTTTSGRRRGAATPSNLGVQAATNAAVQQVALQGRESVGDGTPSGASLSRMSLASLLSPSASAEDPPSRSSPPTNAPGTSSGASSHFGGPGRSATSTPHQQHPYPLHQHQPRPIAPAAGSSGIPQQQVGYGSLINPYGTAPASVGGAGGPARSGSPYGTRYGGGGGYHPYDGYHGAPPGYPPQGMFAPYANSAPAPTGYPEPPQPKKSGRQPGRASAKNSPQLTKVLPAIKRARTPLS
ncbi:hypothetical protein PYCC9005_001331 [Savitreella phatthalungensis]